MMRDEARLGWTLALPALSVCALISLGPILWAAQHGLLPQWLDRGVAVVERQAHLGGTLGRFGINSDSLGGSYLECLEAAGLPAELKPLRDEPASALRTRCDAPSAGPLASRPARTAVGSARRACGLRSLPSRRPVIPRDDKLVSRHSFWRQ